MSQNAIRRGVRESLSGEVKPKLKLKEGLPKQRELKENPPSGAGKHVPRPSRYTHTVGRVQEQVGVG